MEKTAGPVRMEQQMVLMPQKNKQRIRKSHPIILWTLGILAVLLTGLAALWLVDRAVERAGDRHRVAIDQLEPADCVIVPGALVYSDRPSQMLQDRLDVALAVYRSGVTRRILVSGDHGHKDYDEVNIMRQYLLGQGVPAEHIFMDHAGFDTYDTLYRARDVFLVKKAIVTTQTFHLNRALYIGEALDLDLQGVTSDLRDYPRARYYRLREYAARFKAFLECHILKTQPTFLGETIPIQGSGLETVD